MLDYLNDSEYSFSTTYSISEPTEKNDYAPSKDDLKIEENIKDYPLRCPICWKIPRIYFNLKTNNYCILCDEKHKNIYLSFEDLIENADKKFSSLLCHQCKKESDLLYKCNDNNFFFCQKCKENYDSNNFIATNEIDITCPKHHNKYIFYDAKNNKHLCEKCFYEREENLIPIEQYVNYKDTIERNNKKVIENIKMWNNISRIINKWLESLNDKFNGLLSSIGNYCLLQQKIVNYIKSENSYYNLNNNFNIFSNYEAINNEKADNFIRRINEYLNFKYIKKLDFCSTSKYLIDILEEFNKTEIIIESKTNINPEEENSKIENNEKDQILKNKEIKLIKDMNKKKFELNEKVKCIIPFDKDNDNHDFILLGLNSGEIKICETKDDRLNEKLSIKEFKREISHICEIDQNLFVASDINNNLKIIQAAKDLNKYTVIKDLNFEHYTKINKLISLPILSYFKNRHYFAMAADNSILIYKSNKMPINLDPPYPQYHAKIEEFSIVQPSFSNKEEELTFHFEKKIQTKKEVLNMIELNDKYLGVLFIESKSLKLYNTQQEFKDETNLSNIIPNSDCFMKVSKTKKELIIGYDGGFNVIDFDNIKKVKNIKFKQKVEFFDFIDYNNIMCLSVFNNEIYIKQYKFKDGLREMNKISEAIVLNDNKITNFFIMKNKVYYIDGSNIISYYE